MFTKQLCQFCRNSTLKKYGNSCETSKVNQLIRGFSSKKPNKKIVKKIIVTANNDFVTHQLNSTIATHLKRQQKISDYVQEEERKWFVESKLRNKSNNQSQPKRQTNAHTSSSTVLHNQRNQNDKSQMKNGREKYTTDKRSSEEILSDDESDDIGIDNLETPNWEQIKPIHINKNFYKPIDVTHNRSAEEILEFHSNSHIKISSNVPKPIFKFNELNELSQQMLAAIEKHNFHECTPIQSQGIPISLSGSNLLSISQSR